jgi:hypothetical protein
MHALTSIAEERMGDSLESIVAGPLRLNGQDAFTAVLVSSFDDERPLTYVWVPAIGQWRRRQDVDGDEALGLIEWRRIRYDRRKGVEHDIEI